MNLKNTFVQSKMNKDIDERLLPKGQYPDALNIRVANSEGSDVGAIENVRGNEQVSSLGLTNGETIGAYADGSNQKLYWFITSDTKDLVVEHDVPNNQTNILLESTRPDGVLNFDRNYLITGVVKIINEDSDNDMLIWVDDLNPPRIINIERAKTYAVDGFSEFDLSLISRPPKYAPTATLTYSPVTTDNSIENKFLSFAYRYKNLDGGYSALSSFTNYQFSPSKFDLDYQTMENDGMTNVFNAVKLDFDTGDQRVSDVQLVLKESNSNALYVIETFNKDAENWADNETRSFTFTNNKTLTQLSSDELFRTYDNVPKTAKALEIIGSRIAFANYVEQYDLTNIYGEDINIDYSLSLTQLDLTGDNIPTSTGTVNIADDALVLDLTGIELSSGSKITLSFDLSNASHSGSFTGTFEFILTKDFDDASDLAVDPDFFYFVDTLMSTAFENGYTATPPMGTTGTTVAGFGISAHNATSITLLAPVVTFDVGGVPEDANFIYEDTTDAFFNETAVSSSVKTNRSYEVGLIYMDEYGRKSTVLTDDGNTIQVDQEFSDFQNKIVMNINHRPPVWADRYKAVVKQNKGQYQTLYTNLFYEDGLYRWVKLEGANVGKVQDGDTLIVKSDLGGQVDEPIKVRVLEIKEQLANFIEGNTDSEGNDIVEEAGLYMKIKPTGFDMNFDESTIRTYEGGSHLRYPTRTYTEPIFGVDNAGVFEPYPVNGGTRIRIYIRFRASGSIAYDQTYDQNFVVSGDYANIKEWFEAEVQDLGTFGANYTWDGVTDIGSSIGNCGAGLAETNNYVSGYGFADPADCNGDSSLQFYAVPHRKGTATRKITTTIKIEVLSSDGAVIFETEPEDDISGVYYETGQTFDIIDDYHQGNLVNQDVSNPSAIIELDFFNCYVMGNGAESYRYKDARTVGTDEDGNKLLANYLNIDLRPSTTSVERYREVRRYADITYSEPYNENTNLNGLGVFNLSKANYKEDLDKKYGAIQRLFFRDTNLLVFQEDKVGYVLFGKDILYNADGSSNVESIDQVLGDYVAYTGEYGISRNPESFAFDASNVYFIDSKRGCVCRLGAQGITEISMAGMRTFFKDEFKNRIDNKKLGSYDPYLDQYVIHTSEDLLVRPVDINCSDTFLREGIQGVYTVNIDYGLLTGTVGINYSSNGVPVKYDIEYNGGTVSTGYVGDSGFDDDLIALGLPATSGAGTGTLNFTKNLSIPREAKVTITAPLPNTNFNITGDCLVAENLTVVNVILNGAEDEGKSMKSRYKWSSGVYQSQFVTYDSVFDANAIEEFDSVSGNEGTNQVPITGSTVRVESYKGLQETATWNGAENRLGYLITDTLYTEAQIGDLLAAATFPAFTEVTNGDGSVVRYIDFTFSRPTSEQYLYMIWDYTDATLEAVDDNVNAGVGATTIFSPTENDNLTGAVTITSITQPSHGTTTILSKNRVEYVHDGTTDLAPDSFQYTISDGVTSSTATVFITVGYLALQAPSVNTLGEGNLNIINGDANETLTLDFEITVQGGSFSTLTFQAPVSVTQLSTVNLQEIGTALLDSSGTASAPFDFQPNVIEGTTCRVTITGRSSGIPIPPIDFTDIVYS